MTVVILSLTFLSVFLGCSGKVYFTETFSDPNWQDRWIQSKHSADYGTFKLTSGLFYGDKKESQGIQTTGDAKHFALSAQFEPFSNRNSPLVIQYTVKHEQHIECGGSYMKLFDCSVNPKDFNGNSSYLIMFGPDLCGSAFNTIHAIIRYKGKPVPHKLKLGFSEDVLTHLYTFIINPDNTYEILVDNVINRKGNLEDHWNFLPPKKVKDHSKKKPEDWDDRQEVDDPNDVKPEDWPEKFITDPESKRPENWNDELDGKWVPTEIENPKYKREWKPKKIPNTNYKGRWVKPEIDNPLYKPDPELYLQREICGIGFELWQVKSGTIFDNILVTDDPHFAKLEGEKRWGVYTKAEMDMKMVFDQSIRDKEHQKTKDKKGKSKKKKSVNVSSEQETNKEKNDVDASSENKEPVHTSSANTNEDKKSQEAHREGMKSTVHSSKREEL